MKMPEAIGSQMFAPCGMNCMVCFTHCSTKKACGGCLGNDESKPGHCRTCLRKNCAAERELSYCYECSDFPCRRIRDLDRSYRKRYGVSLIEQSLFVKENGMELFLRNERKRYTCTACGGVISLHDHQCSECGRVTSG
ncbi:DUF3795 domain-containing protein [Hungatella sp. L12]|uniref:DUF3795 domain-containing protein n=1 Tax=Hungatella hominis TaxID=2763050 RepID=A0ABR7GZP4_9FIRM|nr:DUF3795 domain-containing protein [Hungatella hominis]MBC5706417.1 DUF3795 domain-containing protein [Hungatella hominis]